MKTYLENEKYDTMLEPSDWRFSAAIVGLMQYFDYHNINYETNDEYIKYNQSDIDEEKYLEFVEDKYSEDLHHKAVEHILSQTELSDEQIKLVNDKLKANTIMKKVFDKVKLDSTNKETILKIINENRSELIKETYGKMKSGLGGYINVDNKKPVNLFKEPSNYCRILGYNLDAGKKGKSTGYNFDMNSFIGLDIIEFDFLPFSFSGNRESFFINDNFSISRLKATNKQLNRMLSDKSDERVKNSRQSFFKGIIESADFLNRDVEVIVKNRDIDYYESLYIRKRSIDVLRQFKEYNIDYESFNTQYKVTDKYYRNIQKEVMNNILNNICLDDLIELYIKENRSYIVSQMLKVNILMRGENTMKDKLKGAFACAKQVSKVLEPNKIASYRQKLTSSIIFKDYDRACQILLQLSNYSNIEFGFVYDLYDDFENNKDLAYTFINALSKDNTKGTEKSNN